jgi:hypothetical protein
MEGLVNNECLLKKLFKKHNKNEPNTFVRHLSQQMKERVMQYFTQGLHVYPNEIYSLVNSL